MEIYKDRSISNENAQQNKAAETLQQLVSYINDLTNIVNQVKLKNEAEFINAYQNHMKKIKEELRELRSKTEEQQSIQNQNKVKIANNDNELVYFREECLKLYQKVELKQKENYELRFKMQELQKSNDFLEEQTKSLMKKVKLLELHQQDSQIIQPTPVLDQTFCTTTPNQQRNYNKRRLTDYQSRRDSSIYLQNQHYSVIRDILEAEECKYRNDDVILQLSKYMNNLSRYINNLELKYQTRNKQLNHKVQSLLISQNKKSIIRSDLETFFLECVETVRRDIQKKRPFGNNSLLQDQIEYIKDFQQFYKEDKQKILELVISNEKILVFLYQKLFPNHVNLVLQSIKEDVNISTFLESSLRQTNNLTNECKIEPPKTTREVRSISLNKQLEVRRGKLMFKQY